MECVSEGRRFFVAKTGYIGVGPRNMLVGDYAFVLKGSQPPFMVRCAHRSLACLDDRIETLNSGTASRPMYLPVEKDAKAPECQNFCHEVHRITVISSVVG